MDRYEEALERARAGMPIDEVFPELKESEDERIRKRLIEYFNDYYDRFSSKNNVNVHWGGLEVKSVIAYLERQKEQKHIDYPYVPGWRKNRDGNKPELKHSVLMLTTHGVAEGEWLGEKWYQYRWSCELKDNEILYWIHLSDLTQLEKEDEIIKNEQKPTEWSEEDEKKVREIYDLLVNVCNAEIKFPKLLAWLKSLCPQPKSIISDTDKSNLKDAPAIIRKSNHPFKENIALIIEKYL